MTHSRVLTAFAFTAAAAVLAAVDQLAAGFRTLVTYNGKAFDVPLQVSAASQELFGFAARHTVPAGFTTSAPFHPLVARAIRAFRAERPDVSFVLEETGSSDLLAGLRAERTLVDGVGGFAAVQYERNAFAGFNRRLDELLGVQWKAIADSSNTLTLDAGSIAFARPKSSTFTSPSAVTFTLAGFRSR
mgnify:CR=1 FL=1